MNARELRVLVKIAITLRDQELDCYFDKLHFSQRQAAKRIYLG